MTTREEAEVIIKVNDKEAEKQLQNLRDRATELRKKLSEAVKIKDEESIVKLKKELQDVNRLLDSTKLRSQQIKATLMALDKASPKELANTIKYINNELKSGRVERGSKEWEFYTKKLRETRQELKKLKREMEAGDSDSGFLSRIKDGINEWGASAAAASAAFAGVVMSGKAAVKAYAEMEAEEANVRKYTGMTAGEVEKLNERFREMDTRTSREELNRLAQAAGRLGKSSLEDVLGFVKAADKLNVALDELGADATLTLSKLTGIFGDEEIYGTEKSLLKAGSVINELSQNCSASAPYLAEFSSRIGGIAAQSKMTISQIMAFAAVLDTQNLAVEASATALGQLITKIYRDPEKIAKAAGLEVSKFAELVKTDMNGALIELFEQLSRFGGMESLATIFDDMGTDGARAIPVLAALSGHIGELRKQQEEASTAFREGTSVTKEFEVQNNTVQAQIDKARKGFTEMAVSLGKELLPVMRHCISGTSMMMRTMKVLIEFVKDNLPIIATLTASIAAYNIALHWSTVRLKLTLAMEAAMTAARKAGTVVTLAYSAATARLTGNVTRYAAALKLLKTSSASFVTAGVGLLISGMIFLAKKTSEADIAQQKLAAERRKISREAVKIDEAAKKSYAGETSRLKRLYSAATDVNSSMADRLKAARDMQALYPEQFRQMSAEEIALGKAKAAYDDLTKAIIDNAFAKAAAQKVKENAEKILENESEKEAAEEELEELRKEKARIKEENARRIKTIRESDWDPDYTGNWAIPITKKSTGELNKQIKEAEETIKRTDETIAELDKANKKLTERFKGNAAFIQEMEGTPTDTATTPQAPPESESEKKKREREEREARKKAMEALKKDLDERKALYLQADAANTTRYVTGAKDYSEYCETREALERKYVDDVVNIHKEHNKIDIAAYGSAIKQKADLLKKQQDAERKRSLAEIERTHAANQDSNAADYYNPGSGTFMNDKAYRQAMLSEDMRYLNEKKRLYARGSEELAAIESEIEKRLNQDKLEKQKETAQAYSTFAQQYRKSSGSEREKMELEILEELHRNKLISEEEYRKAAADIREKYRSEDIEKAREVSNEYSDMVLNLYESFSTFFDDLGQKGTDFWINLSNVAEATFAVMSAALGQYSAYVNAERDLELAKIEKYYDTEIEKASKNEKKKSALEKQKTAEVAKVKTKYNERAMKIELAQAVAQTALAAITSYASASKVNWILGPIAAAMATAAGAFQIAAIKKQHEAEAIGYYAGGFTGRDNDNRKVVGEVHANEFVANHEAVANPALSPVLQLIDHAQRTNSVGRLKADDVRRALGTNFGGGAGGGATRTASGSNYEALTNGEVMDFLVSTKQALERLSENLEQGIESFVVMDGERGLHKKYEMYKQLIENPKR